MTAEEIVKFLSPYFKNYGYYLVFLFTFLENSAFLGLVAPGETVIVIASFFAAQGHLEISYIILLAFFGAVFGDNVGYLIGRKGGRPLIDKFGYWLISPRKLKWAEKYFKIHGAITIFIARFTSFLRALAPLVAGISGMEYKKFLLYDFLGAVIWSIIIPLLGYFFGANWKLVKKIINRVGLGVIVLLIIIYFILRHFRRKKRLEKVV